MIKEAIAKLTQKIDLTIEETKEVFNEVLSAKATPAQIAAFLLALKMKGETADEIFAAAQVVREKAVKLNVYSKFFGISDDKEVIFDTCGTGGSGAHKFNISTITAFVVAASGVKVAKHGNRAVSSRCGSADILEALGIKIDVHPHVMQEAIKNVGLGFLFAPLYHPAFKQVAPLRKEIGVRTIFNILGPLCNPAGATHQLLGVYDENMSFVLAKVLLKLGAQKAFVVYGKDVKDEISITGETKVSFVNGKKIKRFSLQPCDFGLKKTKIENLKVENSEQSARIALDIFGGERNHYREAVIANSAACFYILGKAKTFKEGACLAGRFIDDGSVKNKYLELRKFLEENKDNQP